MVNDDLFDHVQKAFTDKWAVQMANAIICGDRSAPICTNTPEPPGLTLERFEQAMLEMRRLLPVAVYHTSEHVPALDDKGEPRFYKLPVACYAFVDGQRHTVDGYWLTHPDNLPELQRKSKGVCRLVPLKDTEGVEYEPS